MQNVKLCKQSYGAGYALGVEGNPEAIHQFCNWLFNWGITNSEPNFLSDNFAYILIFDNEKFSRFLIRHELTCKLVSMMRDNFLPVTAGATAAYSLGELE